MSSEENPCANETCSGHGDCRISSSGGAECHCEPGYILVGQSQCEPEEDPCEGVNCSGHGECLSSSPSEAVCRCDPGYVPVGTIQCEPEDDPCDDVTCSGHGECLSSSEVVCRCDPGYMLVGEIECEPATGPCENVTCSDHGTCEAISSDEAVCHCDPGYRTDSVPTACVLDTISTCGLDETTMTCVPSPSCLEGTDCEDLALLLHFDGLTDWGETPSVAHDFSGNDNTARCATETCPHYLPGGGLFGGGFEFDGASYLEISANPSLTITHTVTMSAWFYPYSLEADWRPVVSKVQASPERSNYWLGHNGDSFCLTFKEDVDWHNRCFGSYLVGQWYHLVGIIDDEANEMLLYVNGELVIEAAADGILTAETGSVWIGWAPNDNFVEGIIDEVIIWNRVLTEDEILELYGA